MLKKLWVFLDLLVPDMSVSPGSMARRAGLVAVLNGEKSPDGIYLYEDDTFRIIYNPVRIKLEFAKVIIYFNGSKVFEGLTVGKATIFRRGRWRREFNTRFRQV